MNNITKSRSRLSAFSDNSSSLISSQNVLSFHRILHGRPPPTTPENEQSYIIVNSIDNDSLTRSILIDNANEKRGFLPHDYRLANTFETIRRKRTQKSSPRLPLIASPIFNSVSTRSDAFGNLTNSMNKLSEQRLILRGKSPRKKAVENKLDKGLYTMSDVDFVSDIPNALEFALKNRKTISSMERHLLETLKRERLQQARYRLLPINRASYV